MRVSFTPLVRDWFRIACTVDGLGKKAIVGWYFESNCPIGDAGVLSEDLVRPAVGSRKRGRAESGTSSIPRADPSTHSRFPSRSSRPSVQVLSLPCHAGFRSGPSYLFTIRKVHRADRMRLKGPGKNETLPVCGFRSRRGSAATRQAERWQDGESPGRRGSPVDCDFPGRMPIETGPFRPHFLDALPNSVKLQCLSGSRA